MAITSPEQRVPFGREQSLSPLALVQFYAAKFRNDFALQVAYRGAILIWFVALSMQPLVSIVVWTTVARERGGSAGGFTTEEYAAYFIILMFVNQMTFMWHMWEMEWRVTNGFFSGMLLRPMHPIHNDVVENVTFKSLCLVPLVPVAIILSFVFHADYAWTWGNALVFLPAVIMAGMLRFVFEWTIGLAAFWMTRTSSLNMLIGITSGFLAGAVAPLALLPDWTQTLASILPFRWTVSFPVEIALGRLSAGEIAIGFLIQVAWIGASLLAMRFVWSRAVKRYSAVGA